MGTTAEEEYGVSPRRPAGTTAEEGYSDSPGRPVDTTAEEGYGVSPGSLWPFESFPNYLQKHWYPGFPCHFFVVHTHTVKRFRLLQPYFGYLSCIPFVYVTHKFQGVLRI